MYNVSGQSMTIVSRKLGVSANTISHSIHQAMIDEGKLYGLEPRVLQHAETALISRLLNPIEYERMLQESVA